MKFKCLDFIDLPLKMEPIQCSETSVISTQTPGKHPKENIFQNLNPLFKVWLSYLLKVPSTVHLLTP
jgi:hypothetical protein